MKAIEFSNKFASVIKDFFSECNEYEPMPLQQMQDITVGFSDYGFSLRLETTDIVFYQDFNVDDYVITPLHFETH